MTVRNQIRLIVYRIHEKGLEVLLTKPSDIEGYWALYNAQTTEIIGGDSTESNHFIKLESNAELGTQAIAIEADWHDLPKVRNLLKNDINFVTEAIASKIPDVENSAYVVVKEAFKKLMPQEYEWIKELKEVILDRNTLRNI
ncbi:MAG: hypothetical protein IPM92_07175 [Saprospiraceae bacterium]|nr:hypothetical protein [Saprospiraceae bacterium]